MPDGFGFDGYEEAEKGRKAGGPGGIWWNQCVQYCSSGGDWRWNRRVACEL